MADKKEQIEKTEKAVNNFLALVGYASWVCSTIEEKLNESIKVALGTDLNRTMIVLPRSDIRKKIDILRKLLKERDYPKTKLSRAIRVFEKVEKLFERRNVIIHAPWIGVFLQPDGTATGIKHNKTASQTNQFPKTATSDLIKLRSELITCLADVMIVSEEVKNEISS